MPLPSRPQIKIYDPTGSTLRWTVDPDRVLSLPTFSSKIGGGQGQAELDLDLPIDDFGEGSKIAFGNLVRIMTVSPRHPSGTLVYSGVISSYVPVLDGSRQSVQVRLLGLGSLLQRGLYGSPNGFIAAHSGQNPADIFAAILADFQSDQSALVRIDPGSVATAGQNVSYEFTQRTHLQAIEDTFSLLDAGWWWTIDAAGVLWVQQKPTAPEHIFTIGRDIEKFSVEKSAEDVVNRAYLEYAGELRTMAQDTASQADFGLREIYQKDTGITDATTAAKRAEKIIGDSASEKIKASLTISDAYDLESIRPGQTCRVRNLRSDSPLFGENMQIVEVRYGLSRAELQLEEMSTIGGEVKKLVG